MDKTLYMIGNAHIDPVWLWRWQDGFSEIRATFRSALDRMNEYPGFIFTSAAASYYEWIEKCEPLMFEEIRRRVLEGRWAIAGGWWVQPDCNIPSGESLARHALYSQSFFLKNFGRAARTGYNVDSFGHSGSIPKILRMSGMDRYVFMRPGAHEKELPAPLFKWQSPEGQSVTAFRLPHDYCSWGKELTSHIAKYAAGLDDARGFMCFYGVGNHGGGPTRENLDSIAALDGSDDIGGMRLVLSSPDAYFEQAEAKGGSLPTVTGDLLHHASGCYAAHSGVKKLNRQAENRLCSAEKWSAMTSVMVGKPYPDKAFDHTWKKVMFNQFHDILAGTSIIEAYEDARQDFGYALSVADHAVNLAQQSIMSRINIPFREGDRPMVAFNSQAFETTWPVEMETASIPHGMTLLDDAGETIPYQTARASAAVNGRQKIVFTAKLPALGYRTYRLTPRGTAQSHQPSSDALTLENDYLRIIFSRETGMPASILSKRSGGESLREPASAQLIHDESDTWSHAVFKFGDVMGAMTPLSVDRIEDGPVRSVIRAVLGYKGSVLIQDYALYQGLPHLFVSASVNWQEKQTMLKLRFPVPEDHTQVSAQGPFGWADHPANGEEFPMQQWVDISGQGTGIAIANDCKYSYDASPGELRFTVLRSPYYAHHAPRVISVGEDYPVIDQGWQTFKYLVTPHSGDDFIADIDRAASLLNTPPDLLPESFHPGKLPGSLSFASLECTHASLDALKLAQDGSGDVIVHIHETARRQGRAELVLPLLNRRIALDLEPGEIAALRIPTDSGEQWRRVDLVEREIQKNLEDK